MAGWAPETVMALRKRELSLPLLRIEFKISGHLTRSLVTTLTINILIKQALLTRSDRLETDAYSCKQPGQIFQARHNSFDLDSSKITANQHHDRSYTVSSFRINWLTQGD
jgi:hypothetical protein